MRYVFVRLCNIIGGSVCPQEMIYNLTVRLHFSCLCYFLWLLGFKDRLVVSATAAVRFIGFSTGHSMYFLHGVIIASQSHGRQNGDGWHCIYKVEMLPFHLYLQLDWPFWNVFGEVFIINSPFCRRTEGSVIWHSTILVIYWTGFNKFFVVFFVTFLVTTTPPWSSLWLLEYQLLSDP